MKQISRYKSLFTNLFQDKLIFPAYAFRLTPYAYLKSFE
jgi:hypothetical protein